jgi:hypothetical protein
MRISGRIFHMRLQVAVNDSHLLKPTRADPAQSPVQFPLRHTMREIRSSHIKLIRTHLRLLSISAPNLFTPLISPRSCSNPIAPTRYKSFLAPTHQPRPLPPSQRIFFSFQFRKVRLHASDHESNFLCETPLNFCDYRSKFLPSQVSFIL